MNLVLMDEEDFVTSDRVTIQGRRTQHFREVWRVYPGLCLRAGRRNGPVGTLIVETVTADSIHGRVVLDQPTLPGSRLDIILAMPRPRVLARTIEQAVAMGVRRVVLLRTARVEKSYLSSDLLKPGGLDDAIRAGLEQSGRTIWPSIEVKLLFRPYVEDELSTHFPLSKRLLLDPSAVTQMADVSISFSDDVLGFIGPEGGINSFETSLLASRGFDRIRLGSGILRTETAVVAFLAQVECVRRQT